MYIKSKIFLTDTLDQFVNGYEVQQNALKLRKYKIAHWQKLPASMLGKMY